MKQGIDVEPCAGREAVLLVSAFGHVKSERVPTEPCHTGNVLVVLVASY
jgi:hypothetical protein